jgi:DNA-directed RNA polymerase beta subunit
MKTKSIDRLEEKMKEVDSDSLRYHILDNAKNFKTSWVELGRALYSVQKDKMYKEWGYSTFDIYTAKEIGIKKQTALKLLRSYYFLEKEEPQYLRKDFLEVTDAAKVPSYESVDILRQAKNKKMLDKEDYESIKKEIFEDGFDANKVRRDLTALIRERKEVDPQEALENRKLATVRRLLGTLKSLKKEAELLKLLPAQIIKETAELILRIEEEIS